MAVVTKGERREQKRSRKWYKSHLHNNRKSIALLQECIWKRAMGLTGDKKNA